MEQEIIAVVGGGAFMLGIGLGAGYARSALRAAQRRDEAARERAEVLRVETVQSGAASAPKRAREAGSAALRAAHEEAEQLRARLDQSQTALRELRANAADAKTATATGADRVIDTLRARVKQLEEAARTRAGAPTALPTEPAAPKLGAPTPNRVVDTLRARIGQLEAGGRELTRRLVAARDARRAAADDLTSLRDRGAILESALRGHRRGAPKPSPRPAASDRASLRAVLDDAQTLRRRLALAETALRDARRAAG